MGFWEDLFGTDTRKPAPKTAGGGGGGGGGGGVGGDLRRKAEPTREEAAKRAESMGSAYKSGGDALTFQANNVWGAALEANVTGDSSRFDQAKDAFAGADDKAAMEAIARPGFQDLGERTVRELSDAEWNGLSREQQQGVLANFALYQASLADKALGANETGDDFYKDQVQSLFGEDRGSDSYAPNTVAVMKELGYATKTEDLDDFLGGNAFASLSDLQGQSQDNSAETRQEVFSTLSTSGAFMSPNMVTALESGAQLLDAIRNTGSLSNQTQTFAGLKGQAVSQIPEDRLPALDNVLTGMTSRAAWDLLNTDTQINAEFQRDLAEATAGLDPAVVARYFDETYRGMAGTDAFMSYDEFATNWLQKG